MSTGAAADRPPWAPKSPILVIGDFCDDVFLRATASRLSRESPLPVFDVATACRSVTGQTGGAGNVARQLRAYGFEVIEVSLASQTKVRVLAGMPEREVFRLDGAWELAPRLRRRQVATLAAIDFAAVVFVDYHGWPGPPAGLRLRLLAEWGCPVIGDARWCLKGWSGFTVLKMNAADAGDLGRAYQACRAAALILTRGAEGYGLAIGRETVERPAVNLPGPVLNVSGAGDVFTATLAAGLSHIDACDIGRDPDGAIRAIVDAAELANLAAGLRVRKPGYNEVVSLAELRPWLLTTS